MANASTGADSFGTGLLHRVVAHVTEGHDVVVHDPTGGGPILDLLAVALRARRCRVLRFKATGSGRVSDLLAQLTGETVEGMPDEKTLERSFELLCTLDATCGRIVLLVGNAHLMSRKEFRYLHLAAKSGPLQFVLAATDNPLESLDGDLVVLHNRLAAFDPLVIEPGTPLAAAIPPTLRPAAAAPSVNPSRTPSGTDPDPAAPDRPFRRPRGLAELGAVAAITSAVIVFAGVGLHLVRAAPAGIAVVEASATPSLTSGPAPVAVAAMVVPATPAAAAIDAAPGMRSSAPWPQSTPGHPSRTGAATVTHRSPPQATRARAGVE